MIYVLGYVVLVTIVVLFFKASAREEPRRVPLCPSCREPWDTDVDCDMIGHTLRRSTRA